ncbi:hypothetical protein [Streptomyces sp. APSN-46.1]|uniref:hypothetical protein n=1 Tax=Streptomyces sp. APSN-46.1 TaxID=2929049 RepID=UPI0027E53ED6|nr:hypothetical protein [Streptomyces sp. APSN-46.1]
MSQNPYQQPDFGQRPGNQPPGTPYPMGTFGPPPPPPPPPLPAPARNGRKKPTATVVAVCAAAAVLVIAAAVTGGVLLKDDGKGGIPASSPQAPDGSGAVKATIPGWKTVVNPAHGTAFDVPADWEVLSPTVFSGYSDHADPGKTIIGHTAPVFYKSKWCSVDADGDGTVDDFGLASAGTKGAEGAKDTDEVAEKTATSWVYAAYTQPDKAAVKWDKPVPYTTKSGVRGSYVKAHSEGAKQTDSCSGEGQAIAFGFKNSKGDFVAWDFYGRTGVPGAVSDELVMRILSTVRLAGDPVPPPPAP